MDLPTVFSRVYDRSSPLPGDFVPTSGSWDAATNTQILEGSYRSKHLYEVIVGFNITSPAKDLAGNPLTGPNNFFFTTLDAGPSVAVALSPAREATEVDPSTQIRVTFNEPLDASTIRSTDFKVYGWNGQGDVAGAVSYDAATYTAIFTPSASLAAGTKYGVFLYNVKDATGVPQEDYLNYGFTTR